MERVAVLAAVALALTLAVTGIENPKKLVVSPVPVMTGGGK